MNSLTKVSVQADLFGGKKHIFTMPNYGAWITETKDSSCYVTIFDNADGIMVTFHDEQEKVKIFNNYNIAYIWMLTKIESFQNSKK